MDAFVGLVTLGGTLNTSVLFRDGSNTPTDATGNPIYRVYGDSGLVPNQTGSLSNFRDVGAITNATNTSPIVIVSAGHGLNTGTLVTVSGVAGNTSANGTFPVTVIDPNTFSLLGSTGNGTYSGGGTWHVSGLYSLNLTVSSGNGYESGKNYTILVTATVAGTVRSQELSFQVV